MTRTALLLTVTGRDHPGVTTAITAALGDVDAVVVDMEQVVIAGRLVLALQVEVAQAPPGTAEPTPAEPTPAEPTPAEPSPSERTVDLVRACLRDLGLTVDSEVLASSGSTSPDHDAAAQGGDDAAGPLRHHVTLLGHPLRAGAVGAVTAALADGGANIERIYRLAAYPVTCLELVVAGGQTGDLRRGVAAAGRDAGVDVAVQRAGLQRRASRLVVLDVDSTLVQGEVIEMMAERAGCLDEVRELTSGAMAGELDFADSLRARVGLLAGLPLTEVAAVRDGVRLTPGARTLVRTLKRLGFSVGIVSGGFTAVTDHLVSLLDLDHAAANTLEDADGRLTGRLLGPVVDRPGKAAALRRFAAASGVPLAQTVAIGDGANDLDMLALAGLGIAFNAKPVVREAADVSLRVPFLDAVLFLLGIPREEVVLADAQDA